MTVVRTPPVPFGILGLAATYTGGILALRLVAPRCLDEPCQNEGVDDMIIMWASDFFVAFAAICFGFHLHFGKGSTRRSGTLAQIFLAGCFALMGILRFMFPNSGQGDNLGMIEYWIVWAFASFFLAVSACCHTYFAIESTFRLPKENEPYCSILIARLFLGAHILGCVVNLSGCAWCAITPLLHTVERHDNYNDDLDFEDHHLCIQMVSISEFLIWYTYGLLWIPLGLTLWKVSKEKPEMLLGLNTPLSALLAAVFQLTAGSMYLVVIGFTAWLGKEMGWSIESFFEVWDRSYGAEVFHAGMLVTCYCAHNLSWSLTLSPTIQGTNRRPQIASDSASSCQTGSEAKIVRFSGEGTLSSDVMGRIEEGTVSSQSLQETGSSTASSSSVGKGDSTQSTVPSSPRRRPAAIKSSPSKSNSKSVE